MESTWMQIIYTDVQKICRQYMSVKLLNNGACQKYIFNTMFSIKIKLMLT